MIDDLISKPFNEPYRMLSSRAEYRLLLRSDTADARLAPIAHRLGLIDDARCDEVDRETQVIQRTLAALESTWLGANERHGLALEAEGLQGPKRSQTALDIARRPGASLAGVIRAVTLLEIWNGPLLADVPLARTEIAVRYGAFIDKESKEALRHKANEFRPIPDDLDYGTVLGLRVEASQQLAASRPASVGHATRTAGVTPSDIGALLVHLSRHSRESGP